MLLLQNEHLFFLDLLLLFELLSLFQRLGIYHADVLGDVIEVLNELGSLIINLSILRVFTNRLNLHLIVLQVRRELLLSELVYGFATSHFEVYVCES